jgi:hypothetical protein
MLDKSVKQIIILDSSTIGSSANARDLLEKAGHKIDVYSRDIQVGDSNRSLFHAYMMMIPEEVNVAPKQLERWKQKRGQKFTPPQAFGRR